jgi:quercetin dioxygenase-like cupin family protein
VGIFRLYTGDDGRSHIEEQSLASHPALTSPQAASHIFFREFPVGTFLDWHPAPRRQYVIILSGELEIGLGDGTLRRFGPGDARLVEDTTGQGHTTRTIGDAPVLTAVIPLATSAS